MRRGAGRYRRAAMAAAVGAACWSAPRPARADVPPAAPPPPAARGPMVADAAAARHPRAYLPHVLSTAVEAEPCGPVHVEACPGGAGWAAVCGGMGAIRDMVAPDDGSGTVVAVGDGAAVLRLGAEAAWRAQVGQDLTGLNSLAVDGAPAAGAAGWAAGDHNQLVPLQGGCWLGMPWAARNPSVTLQAVRARAVNGMPAGWAVGERAPGRAAVFELPANQLWQDHWTVQHLAPALTDVVIDPFPPGLNLRPGAWAVGGDPDARSGVFLRADGARWRLAGLTADGWPREIVVGDDNDTVRAFGVDWAQAGVMGWAYQPVSRTWAIDAGFARPGYDLVDAYSLPGATRAGAGIWLGLAPRPGAGGTLAVERFEWSTEAWTAAAAPFRADPAAEGGSRAVAVAEVPAPARTTSTTVVFAWNDDVWGFAPGRGTWRMLRRRRRLRDFVPDAVRGHLLAEAPGGGAQLLYRDGDRIVPGPVLDETLDARLARTPLRAAAMAGRAGVTWIVGAGGASVRLRGPLARADVFDLPGAGPRPDLAAVDVSSAGDAWALSADGAGATRLWRFGARDAAWQPMAAGDAPAERGLAAVAALPDGSAWAVGDGTSVHVRPGCPAPPAPGCRCSSGASAATICRHALPPVGPDGRADRAHALAALDTGQVWAAGDQLVHTASAGRGWVKLPALMAGPDNLLRSGERIVALAVGAPDDVWVVAHCGRAAALDAIACGGGAPVLSRVFHFDGRTWREATRVNVPIHDIDVVDGGMARTVWLTGDWTTLVRFTYAAGTGLAPGPGRGYTRGDDSIHPSDEEFPE